jgi:hypothetical protein
MIAKRDMILIGVLVMLAAGLLWLMPALRQAPAAKAALYLRYSLNGQPAATIPLTRETDLTVDQGDGRVNNLHLTPKGFVMASATCQNQLCVHQGEVTANNMAERPLYNMIVCAPHRLVAELLTADEVRGAEREE